MPKTRATRGPWQVTFGAVYGASDGQGKSTRILLADRDNPNTSPVERDKNVSLAADAVNFLRAFVREFGPIFDTDEPYQGSDAVDDLANLVTRARKVLDA